MRAHGPGHNPQGHLGEGEASSARRIDEVRVQRQLAAAGIGGAVNGGNNRNRARAQRQRRELEQGMLAPPSFLGHALALLEVGAGTKRPVATARDDDAAKVLGVNEQTLEKFLLLDPHLGVHGVGHLGPVEGDDENMVFHPLN